MDKDRRDFIKKVLEQGESDGKDVIEICIENDLPRSEVCQVDKSKYYDLYGETPFDF